MSGPAQLEWYVEPDVVRGGVVEAAVAWCGCGWRNAVSSYSRKVNAETARDLLDRHRLRCPRQEETR